MILTPACPLTSESSESVSGVIAQVENGSKKIIKNNSALFIILYLRNIISLSSAKAMPLMRKNLEGCFPPV
jgi:hypothetical protein